jgi:hypothetical protein
MKRILFFALLFPPAMMNLMLVAFHPTDVPRYFMAGYIIAAFPALVITLLDEALRRQSVLDRASYGACAALLSAPAPLWFIGQGDIWLCAQAGCFAAIAAFLFVVAFATLTARKRKPLMLPSPDQFKAAPNHPERGLRTIASRCLDSPVTRIIFQSVRSTRGRFHEAS